MKRKATWPPDFHPAPFAGDVVAIALPASAAAEKRRPSAKADADALFARLPQLQVAPAETPPLPEDGIIGRTFLEKGLPVTVRVHWAGKGPRNVLIQRADGSGVVRPFRGLRKLPTEVANAQ